MVWVLRILREGPERADVVFNRQIVCQLQVPPLSPGMLCAFDQQLHHLDGNRWGSLAFSNLWHLEHRTSERRAGKE